MHAFETRISLGVSEKNASVLFPHVRSYEVCNSLQPQASFIGSLQRA